MAQPLGVAQRRTLACSRTEARWWSGMPVGMVVVEAVVTLTTVVVVAGIMAAVIAVDSIHIDA